MKIYWIKQKLVGLGMIIARLVFANVLIEYEAGITFVVFLPFSIYLMTSKKMYFSSDYIYEFGRNKRRS